MQQLMKVIDRVAHSNCSVLILGETGTGKELVARCIHDRSQRSQCPFVPVECNALVPTIAESELFGYVRGAFTGASDKKRGLLQAAQGGTVLLDEIAELPLDLQPKLLRALQEKEVRPVGATQSVKIDVRFVAATNCDLDSAVREGRFRSDLYYRLAGVTVEVPPLRKRKSDVPLLASHFLEKLASCGQRPHQLSAAAMDRLMAYDWPGNVRELGSCIESAVALSSGPILRTCDLPLTVRNCRSSCISLVLPRGNAYAVMSLKEREREAIVQALATCRGNKPIAAQILGIGKSTLYRKLKEYRIEVHNSHTAG